MSFDKDNLQHNINKAAKDVEYNAKDAANSVKNQAGQAYNSVRNEVENVYDQVKDKTSQYYEEGKKKAAEVQNYFEDHSDELIKMVKEKPLTSLLVAGGVGYLLSKILSK